MAAINRTRTTWWNLFFHYVAIGLMLLNGVVLVPLYLAKIPLETYGYWLATGNILAWLSLVDPGFSAIIQQRVATSYGAGDRTAVGHYLMATILVAVVMGGGVAAVSGMAGGFLGDLLGVQSFDQWDELIVAFGWAAAGTVLSMTSFSLTAGAQGLQGAFGPGAIYTVTQVVALGLTILWLQAGLGVKALGLAHFVRGLGLCLGAIAYLGWRIRREGIVCRFSFATLRELIQLSGFTFLAKIPGTLAGQLDILLAARFLGPEAAAMFGLTRRGYDISRMVAGRPTVALMPSISHVAGEGNHAKLAQLALRMSRMTLWALGLLFAGFIAFNDDFMRLWIGEGHYAGWFVNVLFALGMVLAVVTSSCSNVGFALGDVRSNSLANLVLSMIGIGALWLSALTGNMAALAAAPLVGLSTVGLWYFPRAMSRRLGMTTAAWQGVGRECGTMAIVGAVLIHMANLIRPESWLAFLIQTVLFAVFYGAGVCALSKSARNEALWFWKRVAPKRFTI